jgi:hypothetical protein
LYGSILGVVAVTAISAIGPGAINALGIAAGGSAGFFGANIYKKISDLIKSDVWIERTEI